MRTFAILGERQVVLTATPPKKKTVKVNLTVTYGDAYPDELPELEMECVEGELGDDELRSLEADLKSVVSTTLFPWSMFVCWPLPHTCTLDAFFVFLFI